MRTIMAGLLTAAAVLLLQQVVIAQGPERPGRPGPEGFFQRLDANHDGQITLEEIPEGVPEPLGEMLRRADKNNDKKITREELNEAIRQQRPGPPTGRPGGPRTPAAGPRGPEGPPREAARSRRPDGPRPPAARPRGPEGRRPPTAERGGWGGPEGPEGRRPSMAGRRGSAGSQGVRGLRSAGRPMPPGVAHRGPGMPDPKQVFARLDKDHDGKLSLEEFAEGMQRLHPPGRPPMGMPHGRGPMPGPGFLLERLKAADKDGDGKLSREEAPGPMKLHFDRIDANHDGLVDREELGRAAVGMARRFGAARRGFGPPPFAQFHRGGGHFGLPGLGLRQPGPGRPGFGPPGMGRRAFGEAGMARMKAERERRQAAVKKSTEQARKQAEARRKAMQQRAAEIKKALEARQRAAQQPKRAAEAKKPQPRKPGEKK